MLSYCNVNMLFRARRIEILVTVYHLFLGGICSYVCLLFESVYKRHSMFRRLGTRCWTQPDSAGERVGEGSLQTEPATGARGGLNICERQMAFKLFPRGNIKVTQYIIGGYPMRSNTREQKMYPKMSRIDGGGASVTLPFRLRPRPSP